MIEKLSSKTYETLAILIFICIPSIQFNIDVANPLHFHPPTSNNANQLFGYSLSTTDKEPNSFLVGAPKGADEGGMSSGHVYRCQLDKSTCKRLQFTFNANRNESNIRNEMFGSSIVQLEDGRLVVCAPSYKVNYERTEGKYSMGECYSGNQTNLEKINLVANYIFFKSKNHHHSSAQFGTSLHKSTKNDVIFGAPGFNNWMGSMILMRYLNNKICEYNDDIYESLSYFGYSVTSLDVRTESCFALGGPRSNQTGEVKILCIEKCSIQSRLDIKNKEFGSYFGHSVTRLDLEGDGVDELVISAPLSNQSLGDEGRVYVYKRVGNRWERLNELKGGSVAWGRYGWLVHGVGDVDLDGFEDLLVGAPLEGEGVAYLHYGSKDGFNDSRVQKIKAKKMSSFNVIKRADGYPDILIGSSTQDTVSIFKSRPVHTLKVELSASEEHVFWGLHPCNQSGNAASVTVHIHFQYLIPVLESKTNPKIDKIKDLRYKVVLDERGFVELEGKANDKKEKKHELEGSLDFSNSENISIPIRLLFPYQKVPKNVDKAIKVTLHVLESDRTSGPMLHQSQKKEFSLNTTFKQRFITYSKSPIVDFLSDSRPIPFTLGYQQESIVRRVLINTGEPTFNANFTFEHPRWMSLKKVTADAACFTIECKRIKYPKRTGYVGEVCTSPEALMNTQFHLEFLLAHSITEFGDYVENKVFFQNTENFLEAHYNSNLTVINTLLDSSILHKTPPNFFFSTTHFYDVRTDATHPSFKLKVQEPFSAYNRDTCCLNTEISVILKAGAMKIPLLPESNRSSENPSLNDYLEKTLRNGSSIELSCLTCSPWTFALYSLSKNQSVDVSITTNISGNLLAKLQKFSNFSYHTHLLLTPGHADTSLKDFLSGSFKATTKVYEVVSYSSTAIIIPPTPFWLLFVCILCGLIGVVLLGMLLKACGFFKREKHELLIENKRKSKMLVSGDAQGITVNSPETENVTCSSGDLINEVSKEDES